MLSTSPAGLASSSTLVLALGPFYTLLAPLVLSRTFSSRYRPCDSWPYGAHRFCLCAMLSRGLCFGGGGGGFAQRARLPGDCQPRLSSALLTCEAAAAHCRPDVGTHLQLSRGDAGDGGALLSSTGIAKRRQLRC